MTGLSLLAPVAFVLPDEEPESPPTLGALVVAIHDAAAGCVNLLVLADSSYRQTAWGEGTRVYDSIPFSEGREPGTWHWPVAAPAA